MKAETYTAAMVLAADKGTRAKNEPPKVLRKLAGHPTINHVLADLAPVG